MPKLRIGVIDSGRGGVLLEKYLSDQLPQIEFFSIGDSKNMPYGEKSLSELTLLGKQLLQKALQEKPDQIVVACHTLCSTVSPSLERFSSVPLLNVNRTLLQSIVQHSSYNGTVHLLATKATVRSNWFSSQLALKRPDLQIHPLIGSGLAKAIEQQDTKKQESLLRKILSQNSIETLALACTHYSAARTLIESLLPETLVLDAHSHTLSELKKQLSLTHAQE